MEQNNEQNNQSRGRGDTIHKITTATGIKAVVNKRSSNLNEKGECSPCEKRRQMLNQMFPYNNQQQPENNQ